VRRTRLRRKDPAIVLAIAVLVITGTASAGVAERAQTAPREFVVVALGDSYGSGEGAPFTDGAFAFDAAAGRWQGTAPRWTATTDTASRRCHRSPRSGFARAVELVREAFRTPNVTVTFRSFACSGAGIRSTIDPLTGFPLASPDGGGALQPYGGVAGERAAGNGAFAAQVTQARSFLNGRSARADAVLMSFGGNDFGFARLIFLCGVAEYLADPDAAASSTNTCNADPNAAAVVAAASSPTTVTAPRTVLAEGLARRCAFMTRQAVVTRACRPTLRASYDLLATALGGTAPQTFRRCSPTQEAAAAALGPFAPLGTTRTVFGVACRKQAAGSLANAAGIWTRVEATYPAFNARGAVGGLAASGRVYITTYPDPLEDENGALCDRRPSDDRATRKLVLAESAFLRNTVHAALVGEVRAAGRRNGWTVVEAGGAARRGICADAASRLFNTNRDSLRKQGEDVSSVPRLPGASEPALSSGFVHPNAAGYDALYARQVAGRLRAQICTRFAIAPCPPLP
jgi:hypothetical protein